MKNRSCIESFTQLTVFMAIAVGSMSILFAFGVRNPFAFIAVFLGTIFLSIRSFVIGYEKEYWWVKGTAEQDQILSSLRRVLVCTIIGFVELCKKIIKSITPFK